LALAASLLKDGHSDVSITHDTQINRKVFVTDLNPETVENLKHNIALNGLSKLVEATVMDWSNPNTWPTRNDIAIRSPGRHDDDDGDNCENAPTTHGLYDVVVGSDLIYQKSLVPLLKSVIEGTVKPGGLFLYVAPDTGRDGMDDFLREMKALCPLWTCRHAPPEYHVNPLTNGDDEECFLHFQELYQNTYVLYEFPF
jgi:Met-10+ like-protein